MCRSIQPLRHQSPVLLRGTRKALGVTSAGCRQPGRPKLRLGYDYVHSVVDEHPRLAYSEVLPDERGSTCAAFVPRAGEFSPLTASPAWSESRPTTPSPTATRGDVPGRSGSPGGRAPARPSLPPQTNGKVERFKRVLLDGWAYVRPYDGNEDRVALLPHRLHSHNFHRGHTSLGGRPPISRVNDLGGNST